tara:strand:+ start:1758 stop:1892 length:135 start_codon:yes stop_codon:yes gene_type:complete
MTAYGQAKAKATEMVKQKAKKSFNGHNKGKTQLDQRGRTGKKDY